MKRLLPFSLLLLLCACQQTPTPPAQPTPKTTPETPKAPAPTPASAPTTAPASEATSAPVHNPAQAQQALNEMDTRTPVPLQPMMALHQKQNMQAHLVAVEGITTSLAKEDWDAVAKHAKEIGSSPEMQQMCEHMGKGAPGFTELALEFHNRADKIVQAAAAKDTKAVLQATGHTLQACTSCHNQYRQDVVDPKTWETRTNP